MTWLIAACRTRQEWPLVHRLGLDGFNVYTPCARLISRPTGKRNHRQEIRGAFPSYFFIADEQRGESPLGVLAAAHRHGERAWPVLSSETWASLPDFEIERIQADERAGKYDNDTPYRLQTLNGRYTAGDSVRVVVGAGQGLQGFIKVIEKQRAWLDNESWQRPMSFPLVNLQHI